MAEKEVFATPCWSFIGGDRQIERLLRELPAGQPVVVRNRLANVLPTVASLVDLARMRGQEPLKLAINVPENAIDERAIALDTEAEALFPALLGRVYGVRLEDAPAAGPETVVLALGYGPGRDAEATALAGWLQQHPEARVVFLLAPGQALHPALRTHAATAWSAQSWEGLSAFSVPAVEEAVEEAMPERIVVAGAPAEAVAYTAIGAVDMFIRQATWASGRPPGNLRALGDQVSVLVPASELGVSGTPRPFRALVREHLEGLGATTAPDARFRVTAEAIAIDIV